MKTCYILDRIHTNKRTHLILDFPSGDKPKINMVLVDNLNSALSWKIASISMPILVSMGDIKYSKKYSGEYLWDCIVEPVRHNQSLPSGNTLFFV